MRAGEVATCVKLNLGDPVVSEIAALADFDCIWLDKAGDTENIYKDK